MSGLEFIPSNQTFGKTYRKEAPRMTSDTQELRIIVLRLGQLEKQNRRLKWTGVAIAAAFLALWGIGSISQASPATGVIEAQKVIFKDANGNVRGWIGVFGKGSELILGNDQAQPRMRLLVSSDASDLHFYGSQNSGMNLGVDSGDPAVSMVSSAANGAAGIAFAKGGPNLTLKDEAGFSTVVGATGLEPLAGSGVSQRSAASIVLLNKDKKVIWQAPPSVGTGHK
jgi:hypothetical protein